MARGDCDTIVEPRKASLSCVANIQHALHSSRETPLGGQETSEPSVIASREQECGAQTAEPNWVQIDVASSEDERKPSEMRTDSCTAEVMQCHSDCLPSDGGGFCVAASRSTIRNSLPAVCSMVGTNAYRRAIPMGKRFHYFMSHKKRHSRVGDACEHVARGLHDALENAGYVGFFDTDSLSVIDYETIKAAVRESCLMLVVMTDETAQSKWCNLEWQIAESLGIEVKCVVDLQRFNKEEVLSTVEHHPLLLRHQWSDYTDKLRRACCQEVDFWLDQRLKEIKLSTVEAEDASVDLVPQLVVRVLLCFAGIPCKARHKWNNSVMEIWAKILRLCMLASFLYCLIAEGRASCRDTLFWLPRIYFMLMNLLGLQSTLQTLKSLLNIIGSMLRIALARAGNDAVLSCFQQRVHIAGVLGLFCVVALTIIVVLICYPLLWHDACPTSFAFPYDLIFVIVAPLTLAQNTAVLVYLHLANCLNTSLFEMSFEVLDRRLLAQGIFSFADSMGMRIKPCPGAVDSFRAIWLEAHTFKTRIEAKTLVTLWLHYIVHGFGLMIPTCLVRQRHPDVAGAEAHLVGWWLIAAFNYISSVWVSFSAGRRANDLRRVGRSLTYQTAGDQQRSDSLMDIDLTWQLPPFQIGEGAFLILLAPVVISGVCLQELVTPA
eukprot:TRINITY_DN42381_c0_g1_i2.p1 TRINITY_DN42381_c0_g1~~TRINITY_DN42381_c0_g1_i2.p1  ORF type:complete len:709 (+),score=34.56 TRINITY_DN42381_c0_g1_i2:146-2128(+)